MSKQNILLIGSGGREHALAWKLSQSPKLSKLFIAPGNPGTAECGENVALNISDHVAVIRFCQEKAIGLVMVGPEVPLAEGIADALAEAGIRCFGPKRAAAQIEASKVFAKHFMARHGIPTARYAAFSKLADALKYIESTDYPLVIKASGLAAGKGVILPETLDEARSVLKEILEEGVFGESGSEVVIEERMNGPEVSLMAFTDGKSVLPMLAAQDHKRIFDDDQGPNTGGMGAYAPAPIFTNDMLADALNTILMPTISGLRLEGTPFVGVLYAGLMLTPDGIRVVEFNCRFGDPETQVLLPLLETDLVEIAEACVDGKLAETEVRWRPGAAVCVVMASKGYPGKVESGQLATIGGLPENAICFHAGTKVNADGQLTTSGGRVFGVTAWAGDLTTAVKSAYDAVDEIHFDGVQYRTDIVAWALQADARTDIQTDKRISEPHGRYRTSKLVALPTDNLTYTVNGLAMQVHNEIGPGHAEKFYQRRLAELCRDAGLAVEMEKRVEVWIAKRMIGYLKLDLWIEERLVVECKALARPIGNEEIGQVLTYLAATASQVGMIYNFGMSRMMPRRILAARDVQDWQKHLYRYIHKSPGMVLPPLGQKTDVPPIRFNSISKSLKLVEVPSPTGAAIRYSVSKSVPASDSTRLSAYASSGVSIDAGNRAVELMKSAVKATYTPAVLAGIGSFGGLYDAFALKQMQNPVLVASTDGVGTKVKLAALAGRYRGIGHDIVNHCIDDILVQGARPLFFMDYFATSKLNPEQTAEVVTGIAEACQESGMALLGGETAEMPGVYAPGEFDVAGTIVGVLERERILPRTSELKAGDALIGLRSSGPHTNGYSLIRKVFADTPLDTIFPELDCTLADALLASHRSYFNILQPALSNPHLKALAHLTGGGFIENIPRILPDNLDAVIRLGSWPVPPLWNLIRQKGDIAPEEMYRVFNMGIGMILIVEQSAVAEIQSLIPEETFVVGELAAGTRKTRLLT
jgi:phosphoribosylamine--glycine ligase/phosphoribosylaminoimidazole synthetase